MLMSLLQPLMEHLCLFRALATGERIPGTNLILLPAASIAASSRMRFGRMEQLLMALAGGWLLFRVICCKLADEDNNNNNNKEKGKQRPAKRTNNSRTTSELDMEPEPELEQHSEQWKSDEEQIYWQGGDKDNGGLQPMLRFTRRQLDVLLRLEEEEESDDDETAMEVDSEYLDMSDGGEEKFDQQENEITEQQQQFKGCQR